MVPDDAGPVPYQLVMRPLRSERTISVTKGRLEEVEGAERGFNPPYTAFQSRWACSPLPLGALLHRAAMCNIAFLKQWRLKPLFLLN